MVQKRMQNRRPLCIVLGALVLLVLLHLLPTIAAADPAGQLTIYPNTLRGRHHFAADLNRYYFSNGIVLCAYDLESGRQCWTRFLWLPGVQLSNVFGRCHLALYSGTEGLVVLDAVNGQEKWRHLESRDGAVIRVAFSDRNDLLGILQERAFRVFSSEGKALYQEKLKVPFSRLNALPGTDAFYLQIFKHAEQTSTETEIYVWRPDGGAPVKTFDLQSPGKMAIIDALPCEIFLVIDGGVEATTSMYKTLNSKGETIQSVDIKASGNYLGYADGGRTLLFGAQNRLETTLVDWNTGDTIATLQREGHCFQSRYREDMDGPISLDGQNNVHYWSLNPGEEPCKILDGRNFLPGCPRTISSPYIHCMRSEDKRLVWERRLLDGLEPAGNISVLPAGDLEQSVYQSDSPFRVAQTCAKNPGYGNDWYYTGTTCVYEEGKEEPLIKMEGQVQGISPDGRFIIIQSKQNEGSLVDIENGEILAAYAGKYKSVFIDARFSHDGRRVAVQHQPHVTVTLLAPPYTGVSIQYGDGWASPNCFSPDGMKLLSGGAGSTYIHDVATGKQLQKLNETARFRAPYQYRQGFFNTMAGVAEDFIGNFTDRFKNQPWMKSVFSRNGEEVITIAVNNLLRVWNASSGKELHHIEFNLPEERDHNGSINNCITLSPNGDYALALNRDGLSDISLWSIRTGRVIRRFTHDGPQCYIFAVSDDGRKIYLGRDDILCVYDFGAAEKDNR